MQVQAVFTGQQPVNHIQVTAQFVGVARLAGIISGNGDAAGQRTGRVLEAAHIIPLPAVQADGDRFKPGEGGFRIHTQGGITFFGNDISGLNLGF